MKKQILYLAGTITIKNPTTDSGTNGKDVAIRFGSIDEEGQDVEKFTIDAGSKVVGKTGADGTTEANPNDTLTGIEINGQNYKLGGGKTYTDGDGITIATDDNNKISVNAGEGLTFENPNNDENKGKLKVNVGDGLSITDGKVVNNFKVEEDKNVTDGSNDNWTITDGKKTFTNTTLVNGTVEKRAIQDNAYGSDYLVKDTDGNTATLSDVASATKLKEVAGEAGKHTTIKETGKNVTVVKNETTDGHLDYTVNLNDDVTLGNADKNIHLDGTNGNITATGSVSAGGTTISSTGLTAGKVNVDATTNTVSGLSNTTWDPLNKNYKGSNLAATESQLNDLYNTVAAYNTYMDANGSVSINYNAMTLRGDAYNTTTHSGGTIINNVGYAKENPDGTIDGSQAVNVDYLNDAISDAVEKGGVVSETEKHLATNSGTKPDENATYAPDADGNITISEVNGDGTATGNSVVISDVASKEQVDKNTSHIGDMNFEGTKHIGDGTDNLTDAIKDLDSAISDMQTGVGAQVEANTVSGGRVDKDGNVILETNKDKNIQTKIKLTDSEVVGGKAENGKLTINKKDNYTGAETSIDIEGVATTDMIGAKDKEDLASKYKDADKDGNATTEYITESESMVEADVALDHAIQDVANTSYANDMVLSNRIDSVEKRLGNVEERIDKVGAMAAAIANLRTMGFDPEAPTEIAIGVGQYKSETGLALGIFHYPNQDFMLSASLSSSGDELMGGIGATWKLGRKSAAERAKDEEARHLEQAEEMKKLAQQEKVKAQAQRHAKLLAERQQASQKNA